MASGPGTGGLGVALSVHGPHGVLDVVVPAGATASDLAREYAEQSGLGSIPLLHNRLGRTLAPDESLAVAGVGAGDVLVASTTVHRTGGGTARPVPEPPSPAAGPLATLWFAVAAAVAVLAGLLAATASSPASRGVTTAMLVVATLVGVAPVGRYSVQRSLTAPAFAMAAVLAAVWDPDPARVPVVLGIGALSAAVAAAVARTLDDRVDEGLRVWIVAGGLLFLITAGNALLGLGPAVVWAVLLVLAVLATRFVPGLVVDVPDQLLIDLERLAVSAWSARERPQGRRGRVVASRSAVTLVAQSGGRMMAAAGVAIAAVAIVASGMLLGSEVSDVDRIGVRCQVLFAGGALVLAGRSHRHATPRIALRVAGLGCAALLFADLIGTWPTTRMAVLAGTAVTLAAVSVVVAVASGRGWRSAWWARRAEVAEGLCGALTLAALIVSVGLFRTVWELTSNVAL